jgi:antirestriction protein ArdC
LNVRTTELVDHPSFDMRSDCINLPPKEAYFHTETHTATERYYRSKMHELIHWSGAPKRLDRLFKVFDWNLYAREELVAEAGALLLLSTLGCAPKDLSHHATYFNGWLKELEDREEALAFARREAEKAVNYILEHGTTRV